MTRRRVERLEAAGVGRTTWLALATEGERAALSAVQTHGGDAGHTEDVLRVFQAYRQGYVPGAGRAEMDDAADRALDELRDALPLDVYALALATLRYGQPHGLAVGEQACDC